MSDIKYVVSIRNAKTKQWRDSHETSLAACVALTLGLGTMFLIIRCEDHAEIDNSAGFNRWLPTLRKRSVLHPNDIDLRKRYLHARRSLFALWMKAFRTSQLRTREECEHYRFELDRSDSSLAHSIRVWQGTDSMSIQL
jgi:hypothetical protein